MAVSEKLILETLSTLNIGGAAVDLVATGAVRHLEVDGGTVRVLLATSAPPEVLRSEVERALSTIPGVERSEVQVQSLMTMDDSAPAPGPAWADRIAKVRHVIAVASGKGGVGKSTVAANLALTMARQGHTVGLLDADIYGPSQQLMMGATDSPMGDADGKIKPVQAPGGVRVMSLGFIIDADQPVIWRGPMLMKALEQFFSDVEWGALDYLIVDMPPGTGDVALTLCQNVPLAGVIIVTTPQDVALIDARKGLHMFRKLEVPVLGLVENMSHYRCPDCGHVEHIFGSGGGSRTANELQIPLLAAIPIDPAIVTGGDSGEPVIISHPESAATNAFESLAEQVVGMVR